MRRPTELRRRLANKVYGKLHPNEPWLSPSAVRFLDHTLQAEWQGLEWGSGRSTSWIASRIGRLVSIEHDPRWFEVVRDRTRAMPNVQLRHAPLDHAPEDTGDAAYDPLPRYVAIGDELPDGSLDFVLVDGAYRLVCVRVALNKLRPGGLLVVDNTDWLPTEQWGVPDDWEIRHRSKNVITETTVWTRPG